LTVTDAVQAAAERGARPRRLRRIGENGVVHCP
jgi:hypothetical protein